MVSSNARISGKVGGGFEDLLRIFEVETSLPKGMVDDTHHCDQIDWLYALETSKSSEN